jgi:hypothetical protein
LVVHGAAVGTHRANHIVHRGNTTDELG